MPIPYYLNPELSESLKAVHHPEWDLHASRQRWEETFESQPAVDIPDVELEVEHIKVDNSELELRIWKPCSGKPARLIYTIHGGGYTSGHAHFDDLRNAEMSKRFTAVVVSPDYRLAPEYSFPIPAQDCLAGLKHVTQSWSDIPVYLYGDSAGSGLAETVASWWIEAGLSPLEGIIILEPCIDPMMNTNSMQVYANDPMWNRLKNHHCWSCYLGNYPAEKLPRLFPFASRHDFPRILAFVNPIDPLRDEGIAWVTKLIDWGAQAELHMLAGTCHGCLSISGTQIWDRVQNAMSDFFASEKFSGN